MVILEEQSTELRSQWSSRKPLWTSSGSLVRLEKNRHDAASKVLQAVAKSEVEAMYTSLVQQRRQTQTGVRSLPYWVAEEGQGGVQDRG